MKKRKNVQFIAAAALTAALVTSQFSFATVMGDDTATVQVSSLIPNNVTIDQPVPLSDISLPKSDYGTLSWADGSCVPSARVQTYDVVFRPYNAADLAKISGWDGQSEAIYSSVTVVVSSSRKLQILRIRHKTQKKTQRPARQIILKKIRKLLFRK